MPLHHEECESHLDSVSDALYVIGGKWKLRIIAALSTGDKRFNELQRLITGISARVLSNELKDLELNGFLKRTADADNASVVMYTLMPYSKTLMKLMQELGAWGAMHKQKIMADARAAE